MHLRDGLLLLNAPLRLSPLPSSSAASSSSSSASSFLPLPPPLCSRRRYEKVIMFPLEMARSPSAPFMSKWNNLSTLAFFFFPPHLHLSFRYTTPAPLFLLSSFLLPSFFSPSPQPSSIYLFNPFLFSFPLISFLPLVFAVECNRYGVGACIISRCIRHGAATSIVSDHSQQLLCKSGIRCVYEKAFLSRIVAFFFFT